MKKLHQWMAAASLCMVTGVASAGFSSLVVIGDSLSDNGNVSALTGGAIPPAPYVDGRFSNGPVAAEYMADALGIPMFNFAHGGAKTGTDLVGNDSYLWSLGLNGTGMGAQVGMYSAFSGGMADPGALFMVWGGPNDFFEPTATPALSAANIGSVINGLYTLGARNFFVPNMPDLGLTPEFNMSPLSGTMSGISAAFNALLEAEILSLDLSLPDAAFIRFDTANFFADVLARPADFGMSNVSTSCLSSVAPPNPCVFDPMQQATTLFWDGVHPTTAAHEILGLAFVNAIPEPASALLVLAGLGAFGLTRRRREGQSL